jgi:uncharacterized delta-60 repeat protein
MYRANLNASKVAQPEPCWPLTAAAFTRLVERSKRIAALFAIAAAAFVALSVAPSSAQTPGDLDPSFASGSGKIPNLAIGSIGGATLALQPDGKIVMAGACSNSGNRNVCLARLNTDGSLDTSFDGPDTATPGNGKFLLPIGSGNDEATALALQPDGKIVVVGRCYNGGSIEFCVARLNADGNLDTSFDGPDTAAPGNGKFQLPMGSTINVANALALQPDGKIVVAGDCSSGVANFCLARLSPDGNLDASFDGPDTATPGNGKFLLPIGSSESNARALALQPDGKIVVAGYCSNGSNSDFCLARLNSDGSLDTSFDGPDTATPGNGKFLLPIASSRGQANALALQPDGKIVVAGSCSSGGNLDFCLARLNTDGSFDMSFDGPNTTIPGDGKFRLPIGSSQSTANSLALQLDGKIVVAGDCYDNSFDFCLARLNTDGDLDTSFDGPDGTGNGAFQLSIGTGNDYVYDMALQADGKIVLTGQCDNSGGSDFCVARLHGGEFGAKRCSLDIDGDGVATAETDGLIATRVALGLRGEAVLSGLSFAANAKRNTWPLIRNYLVSQCGMSVY